MREAKKKCTILTVLVLVLPMLFSYLAINNTASSSEPTGFLSIDPPHTKEQIGLEFKINITVTNVINLQGFSIKLGYDDEILEFQDVKNGSMLNAPKDAYHLFPSPGGEVELDLYFREETQPRNGSGTLATITFKGKKIAFGHFVFQEAILYDSNGHHIDFTPQDGDCSISLQQPPIQLKQNYTLYRDMSFGGLPPVFALLTDNIVLDLNGYTINNFRGGVGIEVKNRNRVTIKNGVITNFQYGIKIIECDQVNITNVKISNSIDYAMQIEKSSNVRVCNNSMYNNVRECLSLSSCSFSEVSDNTLSNNTFYGIDMKDSTNNTISKNTISGNTPGGIQIQDSSNNTIFNNNFINNTNYDVIPPTRNHTLITDTYGTSINVWNSSYPYGGNFWDDWNDMAHQARQIVDEKSGKNQTLPRPDGIGDTPYAINKNNQDEYPLINPYDSVRPPILLVRNACKVESFLEKNITTNCSIAIFSDSWVEDFDFNGSTGLISFNVSGGTHCKVTVSRQLLDGVLEVEVDNIPRASFLSCERDYVFADFNYSSGNHKVEIRGEKVMPVNGDMNDDGKVDITDIFVVASNFGRKIQKP
jgi:parallel beta-helix repeat protein